MNNLVCIEYFNICTVISKETIMFENPNFSKNTGQNAKSHNVPIILFSIIIIDNNIQ